ncbi:hypothetical protein C0J52_04209 [Blattella germanica]|nr:hypothetical protein C0J52_04209 [Blattella germanica]
MAQMLRAGKRILVHEMSEGLCAFEKQRHMDNMPVLSTKNNIPISEEELLRVNGNFLKTCDGGGTRIFCRKDLPSVLSSHNKNHCI